MFADYVKLIYRRALRYRLNKEYRNQLIVNEKNPFSIISSNCVGGVILHELGLKFNTPTINLFFEPSDYLKFIENLKYYTTEAKMEEFPMDKEHNYPRGILDNKIIIHFLHYDSYLKAYSKWVERCTRINFNNLIYILSERDGLTSDDVKIFCENNYGGGGKLLLTCNDYEIENGSDVIFRFGNSYREESTGELIDLCRFKGMFTGKRYIDDFDYVNFINTRQIRGVYQVE